MKGSFIISIILSVSIALLLANSCRKDNFTSDQSAQLSFSLDTLRFDTVFTDVGSATRGFKVYNPNDAHVHISNIQLVEGSASMFRLNVDGIPGSTFDDVVVRSKDSIYVFVEVTIDPDQPTSISPFFIEELVSFTTNGNVQTVQLEAWGQNANYIPSNTSAGDINLLSCDMGEIVFDDPRPYVLYGALIVEDCTLRLPAGTRLYIHGGIAKQDSLVYNDGLLLISENGQLLSEGTFNEPVLISGDRIEPEFDGVSGQYFGIRLSSESLPNTLSYTTIEGGIVGVVVDSSATLRINNSKIINTSGSGLVGIHGRIIADNCLIADNGGYGLQIEYGGNYQFQYCTIANYGSQQSALKLGNALCLNEACDQFVLNSVNAIFRNCIIGGSQRDEIEFFNPSLSQFNYLMDHCAVKVDRLPDNHPEFTDKCTECYYLNYSDTLFVDVDSINYHLDTGAVVEQLAIPISDLPLDLDDHVRDNSNPDIGCYELP